MNNDPISTLMQAQTKTLRMDDTVQTAAAFLNRQGLSWAPVVSDTGEALGALSADDLVRFQTTNPDGAATPVWRLCSYKPPSVSPETPISTVARLMVERKIHHVVITEGATIRGVVSSLDFLKVLY